MLRGILDEDPAMTDVWSQYAAALGRLGRYRGGLQGLRAGDQARSPTNPMVRSAPRACCSTLNRLDEARAHAELAIASAPSQAHQALALIAVARKQDDEAMQAGRPGCCCRAGTPDAGIHPRDDRLQQPAVRPGARFSARSAEGLRATHRRRRRDLHFMIGDSLARLERYKEAEPYLEEEVRLYPQHVRARAGLAMLYQSMGRDSRGRARACRSRA